MSENNAELLLTLDDHISYQALFLYIGTRKT